MVSYTGEIYDVATGDELDAWDIAGASEDELFELAYDAVIEREQSMPSPVSAPTDEELRSELPDIIEGGGYILTEEGIELVDSPLRFRAFRCRRPRNGYGALVRSVISGRNRLGTRSVRVSRASARIETRAEARFLAGPTVEGSVKCVFR